MLHASPDPFGAQRCIFDKISSGHKLMFRQKKHNVNKVAARDPPKTTGKTAVSTLNFTSLGSKEYCWVKISYMWGFSKLDLVKIKRKAFQS